MKWLLGFVLLFSLAQAQKLETLRPTQRETKTVAGLFRSPFYHEAPDSWIWPLRGLLLIDAGQTYTILDNWTKWKEQNPLYRKLNGPEGAAALLFTGWLAERATTGIKDRVTRNVVGWLLVGLEAFVVIDNSNGGVPLFTVKW